MVDVHEIVDGKYLASPVQELAFLLVYLSLVWIITSSSVWTLTQSQPTKPGFTRGARGSEIKFNSAHWVYFSFTHIVSTIADRLAGQIPRAIIL